MNKKLLYLFLVGVLIIGLTGCSGKHENSSGTNTSTGTNTDNSQQNILGNELEKNIKSNGAVTAQGELVVFVTNNNKVAIDMEIEVEFYDAKGTIVGSDSTTIPAVGANSEVATNIVGTPSNFDNYKIYVDVEETEDTSYFDNLELVHNNTGEQIAVQVKNKSNDTIEFMTVSVVYYQGDKVVGYDDNFESDTKSGRAANFNLDFPYDEDYEDVKFDNYKVFIVEAYS